MSDQFRSLTIVSDNLSGTLVFVSYIFEVSNLGKCNLQLGDAPSKVIDRDDISSELKSPKERSRGCWHMGMSGDVFVFPDPQQAESWVHL